MKRRIIHYTNRGGRYGNHLIQFAHWIGYACENPDTEIVFPPYWPMFDLSLGTENNPYCIFPFDPQNPPKPGPLLAFFHSTFGRFGASRGRWTMWAMDHALTPIFGKRHAAMLPEPQIPMSDPRFVNAMRSIGSKAYLRAYHYRDWGLVEKHQAAIRQFIGPASRFVETADAFMAPVRSRFDPVIGVFIRQGDYRSWHGGQFFLTTESYVQLMMSLQKRFGPRAGFVIASDEAQDVKLFAELPHVLAPGRATGPGHYLENVAVLSKCDYIATVPSTSGVFPAFFGDVPIIPINGPLADLRTEPILQRHLFDSMRHPIMSRSIS